MKIIKRTSSRYAVIESGENQYWLVKVIGKYTEQEIDKAYADMINIMNNKTTEKYIEKIDREKEWQIIKKNSDTSKSTIMWRLIFLFRSLMKKL
jgi:disulfide oxidoreductase YuzD